MPDPTDTAAIARLSRERNNFDFLRLFAAVIVLFGHSNLEFDSDFLWGIPGRFDGVAMFFILSGMLIYLSAEKVWERTGRWRDFYLNRYLRIAPGLYAFTIALPVVLVLVGAVSIASLFSPQLLVWFGGNAVLVPGYEPDAWAHVGVGAMTWPLYTIPAEVSFYLITPILVLAARRFGFWPMLLVFLALGIAGSIAYALTAPGGGIVPAVLHHTFLEKGACFAVGIFWAKYWGRIPVTWWLVSLAALASVGLAWLDVGIVFDAIRPFATSIPMGYLLMVVGYQGPKILSRLTERVGDLSYATYIWHYTVINVFLWFGVTGSWWNPLAVLGVTLVIAVVSWHAVEKPALALKRVSLRDPAVADDRPSEPPQREASAV